MVGDDNRGHGLVAEPTDELEVNQLEEDATEEARGHQGEREYDERGQQAATGMVAVSPAGEEAGPRSRLAARIRF